MGHEALADLISATHESWKAAVRHRDGAAADSCARHLEWLAGEALRRLTQLDSKGPTHRILVDALIHVADDVPNIRLMLSAARCR